MKTYHYAIVVGASSGIGAELVKQLVASGTKVAAVARRSDRLADLAKGWEDQILTYSHDVTHFHEVPELFQTICKDLGGLDLIIYSAGVMPEVGPEEFDFEKDKAMIDVNLLGGIAWLNEAAVRFENTGHGAIVGIGSVAGDRGRVGQPVYNASKAAFATYLEALRNRLAKKGVTVATFKPGPTATEMTAHLHMNMMSAEQAAKLILEKSDRTGEHYLKLAHRIAFKIIRTIPSPIFRRLSV